ncbi:hypothetical protein H8S90_20540 [Olivibacter sp. SDN3]|uniref:hypothetical protein n=1 Tax=Olivibacter sp. SDN3 TaxID=2764720 RepID=UPI0016517C7F|nr:hypothetical protein [Olivibacter sp. SDN3]QNL49110.1 hypothetical protein H8S90_20540 [Olivibacter sp. SDN3]
MKTAYLLTILLGVLLFSCSNQEQPIQMTNQNPYFDIKGYFKEQMQRLEQKNNVVIKTVSKNNDRESQRIEINNWENELELFTASDINKPDWLKSYRIDSTENQLVYKSNDPKLRTKLITIYKGDDGTVERINIINSDENWLYSSEENLDYIPDSTYRIRKQQAIRFIGENQYEIIGELSH